MSKYDLVGIDGNAFYVIAYVIKAMKREGYTPEEIADYKKDAESGDYDNLLGVSFEMIEKVNEKVALV